MTVEEITKELVLWLEKENQGPYVYFSPEVDEMGAEVDGYLNFKEIVQFVLDRTGK